MSQDKISLDLQTRDVLGKAVKHLRKEGLVPAVVHDHGKPSISVQGDYNDMLKTFHQAGKHHPVEVTAGGKKYMTIIKTATFDPKKNALTHIVFNAVNRDEVIEAEIPVRAQYAEGNESSPAERASLIVLTQADVIVVKAKPADLPDFLAYDAEKLVEVGDSITVADLIVPANVSIESDAETTVATVYEPSALAAANDAAGGDEDPADAEVPAENGSAEDDADSQAEEGKPGGKKGFESNEDHKNES